MQNKQDKTKKKTHKKEVKLQDLKPAKDAKGGANYHGNFHGNFH